MNNNYLEILLKMGLSSNEAKVYMALLKKKISNVSEIVTLSGVPQKMIYYILQKLMQKGLCTLIPGKIKKYKPANPDTGIGNFISQAQQQISLSQEMLSELKKDYERGQNETGDFEYIEIIQNKTQITEKVIYLEKKAKEEVLSFNKPPYAMTKRNVEEVKGLKKGIKYKSIYQVADLRDVIAESVVEMYRQAGEEVRVTPELPIKMMIFDNKIAMFALEDHVIPGNDFSIVVIQNSNLLKILKESFNTYWQNAMTYEEFINKEKISVKEFIEKDQVIRKK